MILGIGVDVVDVARFERQLAEQPALTERLFVPSERGLSASSLAARFAAKEATIKAFGGPIGTWHDVWVDRTSSGRPELRLDGELALEASRRGVAHTHLSLAHDGGVAIAYVIIEGAE